MKHIKLLHREEGWWFCLHTQVSEGKKFPAIVAWRRSGFGEYTKMQGNAAGRVLVCNSDKNLMGAVTSKAVATVERLAKEHLR